MHETQRNGWGVGMRAAATHDGQQGAYDRCAHGVHGQGQEGTLTVRHRYWVRLANRQMPRQRGLSTTATTSSSLFLEVCVSKSGRGGGVRRVPRDGVKV